VIARFAMAILIAAVMASPLLAQSIPVPQKRPENGDVPIPQEVPTIAPKKMQDEKAQEEKAQGEEKEQAPAADNAAPAKQEPEAQAPAADAPSSTNKMRWAACPAILTGAVTGEVGPALAQGDCGTESPVTVTAIGTVKFGGEATMTCGMATALAALMPDAVKAASDILGSPLASLEVGTGYQCRNRNGDGSGKLSQHAFANAVDIAAFKLVDGRSISVVESWPHLPPPPDAAKGDAAKADADASPGESSIDTAKEEPAGEEAGKPAIVPPLQRATTPQARFLATVHKTACTLFSTVLGPDANAAHRDHFHFDLGCHGRDCKYLICE
jgi:hypothetical protein